MYRWNVSSYKVSIPRRILLHIQDNVFLSQTPIYVVIGLLDTLAFNDVYSANPLNL